MQFKKLNTVFQKAGAQDLAHPLATGQNGNIQPLRISVSASEEGLDQGFSTLVLLMFWAR